MRREDRRIVDDTQIAAIISRAQVLRLALNTDTVPYILPVNFGMEPDGMTLYIHGAMTGTKYELIARDNRASFEVDVTEGIALDEVHRECSMAYVSVIGWGYLEELMGEEEKRRALDRIMTHYHAEHFPYSDQPLPRTRIFCLRVRERTAKGRMGGSEC